ncbi:MAG: hypothetical protein J0M04_12220 [Verrucomicrobia bacterium]|nr:hypothetical protein [Verrucomicrobiota bacterium]
MSPREKNLLILFALGGFAILNLLGFKYYAGQKAAIEGANAQAKNKLKAAEMISSSREEVAPAMEWINARKIGPSDFQIVQSTLQEFAEKEATGAGLTVKSQKGFEPDTTGPNYHRVKYQFVITGTEQALYRWFDRLNDIEKFRAVTFIRLSPNKEDDTKIDCTAIVEQWFVPASPES